MIGGFTSISLSHTKPLISIPCSESIPHPAAKTSQEQAGAQDHRVTVALLAPISHPCSGAINGVTGGWCRAIAVGHVSLPREPAAPLHLSLLPAPDHTKPLDSECLICFQNNIKKGKLSLSLSYDP